MRRISCIAVAGTLASVLFAASHVKADETVQTQPSPVRLVVAGDSRGNAGFVDVLKAAKAVQGNDAFAGLITPGDMDPISTTRKQIGSVFGAPGKPALLWYPVVGNHEAASAKEMAALRNNYQVQLSKVTTAGPEGCQSTTFAFDVGAAHVVILDEYWSGGAKEGAKVRGTGEVVPALRKWLQQDLMASKQPFKVVVGHEPAYPKQDQDIHTGRHDESALNRNPKSRDAFWKVLEEQGATLYICGHTHRYSRWRPEGSKAWQIDAVQVRNDSSWKYDAFLLLTVANDELRADAYRQLTKQGKWEVTDTMTLHATQAATMP